MEVLPIHTALLEEGDDLASILGDNADLQDGDILCISSKAVATVEGAAMLCDDFDDAVEREAKRMNGTVIRSTHGVMLTELSPDGMEGTFLVPNAGLDKSNVQEGYVIGWPVDPVASISALSSRLRALPVILTDSGLSPRRRGVTAFAIACCGVDPILSIVGKKDLFGGQMRITEEAIADQLATIANTVMGNSNQSVPAAIIRGHGLPKSDYCGYVPGIKREDDLYHDVI